MDIREDKKALRQEIKRRKAGLTQAEMERQARDVFSQLTSQTIFREAATLLAYWALPDELPTEGFINSWYAAPGKRFLLPVVKGNDLELYEYTGPACLHPQPPFGILEPQGTQRVGRGRGYYDRLLPQMPQAIKVGVCLREQLVAHVPCEAHDLPKEYLFYSHGDPSK